MNIPGLDHSDFTSSNNNKKERFAGELGQAYEAIGFVARNHHYITNTLVSTRYEQVQYFFALPLEKKLRYEVAGLAGQRGYSAFGREHAKGSAVADLKGFFQFGQPVPDNDPNQREYADNVKEQEWAAVSALPGQIIVNVGDILQRLTNNKSPSTTHRVVNPPRELWHTSRFSIPFFFHPRSEMSLACLSCCVDEKHSNHTPDITTYEYLDERLREIGLIIRE